MEQTVITGLLVRLCVCDGKNAKCMSFRLHALGFLPNKIGNIDIIGNFVFQYICSSLLYLYHMMLANVTLDASWYK